MTDPAIIAASYAAEINYTHNPDDIIDPSGAVLAIGTEKVDTTTLKDRSLTGNDATIHGPMPTEGFIQGRRFTAANEDYLDCGNDISLQNTGAFNISALINTNISKNDILGKWDDSNLKGWGIKTKDDKLTFGVRLGITTYWSGFGTSNIASGKRVHVRIYYPSDGTDPKIYVNGIEEAITPWIISGDALNGFADSGHNLNIGRSHIFDNIDFDYFTGKIYHTNLIISSNNINDFNTFARLPFWSVNYTDYPDNVAEYTDNLPYSSSIISSGTFKVDDDKLQCVSAGTMTYHASYEFDGSEYIKVTIDGVEYAGTGIITQGNTTVSVAQGSNKVTIVMGTGDTIEGEIGIQFREEV